MTLVGRPDLADSDVSEAISIGFRIRFVSYVFIANFAAYVYDWLLCVSDEVQMITRGRMTYSIAVYIVSRFSQISYLGMGAAFLLIPGSHCESLVKFLGAFATISVSSTSFLFLQRVRAVYLQSTYITVTFGAFWLVITGLNVFAQTSLSGEHQSLYGYAGCSMLDLTAIYLRVISTLVNDTVIFGTITYRLAADASAIMGNQRFRLLSIMKGKGLYSLSRSLLLTGQLYYISTILYFFINLAIFWSPPSPIGAQYLIAVVHIAFTNMMACRVFRGVALGTMHMEVSAGLTSTGIAAALQ